MFATNTEVISRWIALQGLHMCLLCCVQDMCAAEATASLLHVEENFSACLARIDALIFKPLLQAGRLEKTSSLPLDLPLGHWHTYEGSYT